MPLERLETPDPVCPDAVDPRFHDVRQDRDSGLLLEYRDLALAVGGEGGAVPARPAVPEPEARHPGHEVELGRPDVPVGRGVAHQAAVGLDPVVRPRDLPGHVVEGLDPDVIGSRVKTRAVSPGGTRRSWGTITSTTKQPPGAN